MSHLFEVTLMDRGLQHSTTLELPLGSAQYTCVPREVLSNLHVEPDEERDFVDVDGKIGKRSIAWVIAEIASRRSPTPVVFGIDGDFPALGQLTLAELGLSVDGNGSLVWKRHRARGPHLVT